MLKLSIKIANDKLLFSECKRDVSQVDINNTNVYNNRLIVFDENYIKKNYNLIASYIKVILAKNRVKQAAILNLNIASLALIIINAISSIETLHINPNKEINFETYELLNKNKYLKYVNCYSMPRFMFEKLNNKKNFTIDLRSEIIWFSSNGRKITIKTLDEEREFYGKLDDIERQIGAKCDGFIRIAQSYLVNSDYVSSVTHSIITMNVGSGKEKLKIAEVYRDDVKNRYMSDWEEM